MVDESRTLAFNMGELQEALLDFSWATDRALPKGQLRQVSVAREPEITATLTFTVEGKTASFTEYEITAALIQYCAKQNIPISKRARKKISAVDGVICLTTLLKS